VVRIVLVCADERHAKGKERRRRHKLLFYVLPCRPLPRVPLAVPWPCFLGGSSPYLASRSCVWVHGDVFML